jgi:hypothetical protein
MMIPKYTAYDWVVDSINNRWPENQDEPHWIDAMYAQRGWKKMDVGSTYTVTVHGEIYEIKRLPNAHWAKECSPSDSPAADHSDQESESSGLDSIPPH